MRFSSQHLDRRISNMQGGPGQKWIGPVVDVMDTVDAVHCWCLDNEVEATGELLVGLTKLILERYDATSQGEGAE